MIRILKKRAPQARRRNLPVATLFAGAVCAAVAAGCSSSGSSSDPVLDTQAARGLQTAKDRNCTSCHTRDGGRSEGPTWKGLYGSAVQLTDGSTVTADDAYLTTSIKEPRRQIVRGFQPQMPVLSIPDNDVADLVAYIKALK